MYSKTTNHLFSMIPKADIPRSTFDTPHRHLTTMDAGYLVPIMVDEVVPGDTRDISLSSLCRMSTPLFPIMDNMYLDIMAFSVPYRILWTHFKNMMGEQKNPSDSIDYICPTITAPTNGFGQGSLADYFGINPYVSGIKVNSLMFRAYNKIYNDWFRDENLIDSVPEIVDDSDDVNNYILLKSGKRHDYFTSCLPFPQKGVAVDLPLGSSAPVLTSKDSNLSSPQWSLKLINSQTGQFPTSAGLVNVGSNGEIFQGPSEYSNSVVNYLAPSNLYADLSKADAVTINSLRQAIALQVFYEKCARGGTRYTELIREHFGVVSPDARQQRPEFLGGFTTMLNVNSVPQTSASVTTSGSESPQGKLSAYATFANGDRHLFKKSFTEYGCIIVLARIRADLTYQQGIPRKFSRSGRLDFYYPIFAHLGEQAVLKKEIYATGTDKDEEVFGYQERFAEMRYFPNMVTGKFRSDYPQSLDAWHLAQDLSFEGDNASLNQSFIEENVPMDRVEAVPSEPDFICDFQFRDLMKRPMPLYSTPSTLGL